PVAAAVGTNVTCPLDVNVASDQRRAANCEAGDQSNSGRGTTTVDGGGSRGGLVGGPIVAPVTGGFGLNVSCPAVVNVLSRQRDSANCAAADQSNSGQGSTSVNGGGSRGGLVGGPIVAPITGGIGLNLSCPAVVNVLSSQRDSANCAP